MRHIRADDIANLIRDFCAEGHANVAGVREGGGGVVEVCFTKSAGECEECCGGCGGDVAGDSCLEARGRGGGENADWLVHAAGDVESVPGPEVALEVCQGDDAVLEGRGGEEGVEVDACAEGTLEDCC